MAHCSLIFKWKFVSLSAMFKSFLPKGVNHWLCKYHSLLNMTITFLKKNLPLRFKKWPLNGLCSKISLHTHTAFSVLAWGSLMEKITIFSSLNAWFESAQGFKTDSGCEINWKQQDCETINHFAYKLGRKIVTIISVFILYLTNAPKHIFQLN